jgi:DNA-binding transcriptional LysR family regulator
MADSPTVGRVELRQLRYFVTLADECHFGRAAAREHIVQSALSQQIQRLERELGVSLVERSTHHVRVTEVGEVFLDELRRILCQLDYAVAAAHAAPKCRAVVRVAVPDASLDSMSDALHSVQDKYPELEIHQIEAGLPTQLGLLRDGRIDVGMGGGSIFPPAVTSEVVRLDPVGMLLSYKHTLAKESTIPVSRLSDVPLLLAHDEWAPEFNQFVIDTCREVGVAPTIHRVRVQSMCAAAQIVARRNCAAWVPQSCRLRWPGTCWVPLVDPQPLYAWSLLWRADNQSEHLNAVLDCVRELSRTRGWTVSQPRRTAAAPLSGTGTAEIGRTATPPPSSARREAENLDARRAG